jgi:hypothetical protein
MSSVKMKTGEVSKGSALTVCGEAQLNDEKDCQNGVNDGDDTHSHDEYDTDVVWQKLLGEDSRSTGLKM